MIGLNAGLWLVVVNVGFNPFREPKLVVFEKYLKMKMKNQILDLIFLDRFDFWNDEIRKVTYQKNKSLYLEVKERKKEWMNKNISLSIFINAMNIRRGGGVKKKRTKKRKRKKLFNMKWGKKHALYNKEKKARVI